MNATAFLSTPARQAAVVEAVDHRPWPLPGAPWAQAQTWDDVCFLHWRADEAALRALLPDALEIETFDGSGWLGVVPFRVSGLRLRGLPPLPLVSAYSELNVRTYVTHGGRPGIWFFSLDASSRAIVEAARRLYRLPYRQARIDVDRRDGWVRCDSSRHGAVFSARYRGEGDAVHPAPGSLERFLTERYCLYAADGAGQVYRADIHHRPWSLQAAEAVVELCTLAPPGVELPAEPPHARVAARQDVVIWGLERID